MKRIATAAIAIPVALLITIYSPDWLLALIAGLLSALMLDEFLNLAAAAGRSRPGRWVLVPAGLVTASFLLAKPLESVDPGPFDLRRISGFASSDPFAVSMMLALTVIIVGIVVMFSGDVAKTFDRISTSLGGIVYCCVLFGFLVLLPRNAILHLFVIIWAGDSAAYYGGRAFGAHKLAPAISPNKTVEGAVAGLVGSVILGSVFAAWLSLRVPWQPVVIALAGIAGQLGDLVESALKRSAGVKDSSTLLPGHGGILDRLDSLLFAAPVYFFLAHFLT